MGKIINRVRERAIEARRTKLLKEQMNQPLVLEVQPVDRSRAARKERVAVCEALGLEPWADLHNVIIPAIEGLKSAVTQERTKALALCDAITDEIRDKMEKENTEAGKIPWRMAGRAGLRIRRAIATM